MTQQTGNLSSSERTLSALFGLTLSLLTIGRRNPALRVLAGTAGAALLARAYAGHCGIKAVMTGQTSLAQGLKDQWGRIRTAGTSVTDGLPGSPAHAAKSKAVDQSVEDSFPASDPPASRLKDVPPVNAEDKWRAAQGADAGQAYPAG
ncbi:MAG: YgaP-like transmembrane domain [Steroidobacteraceae bacterium]